MGAIWDGLVFVCAVLGAAGFLLMGVASVAAAIVGGQAERARRKAIGETVDRVLAEERARERQREALRRARELAGPDHDTAEER